MVNDDYLQRKRTDQKIMQEDEAVWDLYIRNDGLLRSLFWLAHVCTFEFYRSAWMFSAAGSPVIITTGFKWDTAPNVCTPVGHR